MGEWKRWAPPAIGAAMVVAGILLFDWANLHEGREMYLRLSPASDELCFLGKCVDAAGQRATWGFLSKLVLGIGVLAALGLTAVTVKRYTHAPPGPLDVAVRGCCVALAVLAVCAAIATGASLGDLGPGAPVTLIGAVLGFGAGSRGFSAGAFDGGVSARPIVPVAVAQTARPDPVRAAPVRSDGVRFVIAGGTLEAGGLRVRVERGAERMVAWSDIVEVVARRLPPDPPYDKTTFVDLVVRDGPPVRILPTSRLDYAALPGGMAANTRENLRRLVALAREHHPAIAIEAESAEFFAGGRDAVMFPAFKKFAEWDRRYQ